MTDEDIELDQLVSGVTGRVLQAIADDPYIVERDLKETVAVDDTAVDDALETLSTTDAIVSLTRESGSELESRVPETAYVLNPDRETSLRRALEGGSTDG